MNDNDNERIEQKNKQHTDRDAEQQQHKTSVETIAKWPNDRQRNKYAPQTRETIVATTLHHLKSWESTKACWYIYIYSLKRNNTNHWIKNIKNKAINFQTWFCRIILFACFKRVVFYRQYADWTWMPIFGWTSNTKYVSTGNGRRTPEIPCFRQQFSHCVGYSLSSSLTTLSASLEVLSPGHQGSKDGPYQGELKWCCINKRSEWIHSVPLVVLISLSQFWVIDSWMWCEWILDEDPQSLG